MFFMAWRKGEAGYRAGVTDKDHGHATSGKASALYVRINKL
jgi:hypothetical protein